MAESLETGLVLMATGMGTVFALLALLVWMVRGVSRLARWLEPPIAAPTPPAAPPAGDELITVIGAAVSAFKRDHDGSS